MPLKELAITDTRSCNEKIEKTLEEEDPQASDNSATVKRKRGDDTNNARRKKARLKKRVAAAAESGLVQENEDIDEDRQINRSVGRMDGTMFADYMARAVKRFEPELSLVEMEDLRIPQSAFAHTTWSGQRVHKNMPDFLERSTGLSQSEFTKTCNTNGSPHMIVLCAAAIRAASVTRTMKCYQSKDAAVAKLFAKHIKLKDAINFARSTRISIGVGTAHRIDELINEGALSLGNLRHIIIDASWSGPKKRTILEQSDAAMPTIRLLAREDLKSSYEQGKTSILIF